jgi:hypothetical protein
MPWSSALLIGAMKALGSMIGTPMPSALLAMAVFMALTIWLTMLFCEPVHW